MMRVTAAPVCSRPPWDVITPATASTRLWQPPRTYWNVARGPADESFAGIRRSYAVSWFSAGTASAAKSDGRTTRSARMARYSAFSRSFWKKWSISCCELQSCIRLTRPNSRAIRSLMGSERRKPASSARRISVIRSSIVS